MRRVPDPVVVLTLVIAILIPIVMIAGGIWLVSRYAQRKIRRDMAREREQGPR